MALGTDTTLTPGTAQDHHGGHGSVSSVAISSSALLGSATKPKPRATPVCTFLSYFFNNLILLSLKIRREKL